MSFLHNDGKYEIYIIQHKYLDKDKNGWANSGDCCQFIPKNMNRNEWENLVYNKGIFSYLGSNGNCWQETGLHGSYNRIDAIRVMDKIAEWHPEHRFRVCKLKIEQKTIQITEAKYD